MMNIDNGSSNEIETIQGDQAIEAQAAGQDAADAEYEAAFQAELEAENGITSEGEVRLHGMTVSDGAVPIEQAAGDANDADVSAIAAPTNVMPAVTNAPEKPKAPPAYLSFIAAIESHAKALGLSVKEQKSWFQFWSPTGHKLYVEKALKKGVSRIDTSLPRSALMVNGRDISLPLSKPSGRIACHVDPSVESVKEALVVLATYSDKIPAPRKPVAAASQPAV